LRFKKMTSYCGHSSPKKGIAAPLSAGYNGTNNDLKQHISLHRPTLSSLLRLWAEHDT
jgi:hypothetical protein